MLLAAKKLEDCIKFFRSAQVKELHNVPGVEFTKTADYDALKKSFINLMAAAYELRHLRYRKIDIACNLFNSRQFLNKMFEMITDEDSAASFVSCVASMFNSVEYWHLSGCSSTCFEMSMLDEDRFAAYDPKIISAVVNAIKLFKNRNVTVLDTDCFSGDKLFAVKNELAFKNITAQTFGLCKGNDVDRNAYNIDRTIYGSEKFTISNNVFYVVFCAPVIKLSEEDLGNFSQKYNFFTKSMLYLRTGGIYVLKIPFYRIEESLAILFNKYLENVHAVYSADEFVYIVATKRIKRLDNKDIDRVEVAKFMDIVLAYENESSKTVNETSKLNLPNLPVNFLTVDKFRGGEISDKEINELYQNTPANDEFWNAQHIDFDAGEKQRPLLPFTIGQIGLILTSGFLDGVIDEGNGYKHLVKGRVKKYSESNAEIESSKNKMNVTEIIGNRVEINVFLPDGTFKELI